MRCANPGPCSSQPQGHITAFKFQRIRCTICFTSPDNHQKKETTPGSRVPAWFLCHGMMLCRCDIAAKKEVSECSARLHSHRGVFHEVSQGTAGSAGHSESGANGKASCCTLLKRITNLKCVNSAVRTVITHLKRVASNGSMAPCRSHHGNHTRQEWIIIWSGRNWILKHANLILNSFHVHDLQQNIPNTSAT